jgi:hypothetical protein
MTTKTNNETSRVVKNPKAKAELLDSKKKPLWSFQSKRDALNPGYIW